VSVGANEPDWRALGHFVDIVIGRAPSGPTGAHMIPRHRCAGGHRLARYMILYGLPFGGEGAATRAKCLREIWGFRGPLGGVIANWVVLRWLRPSRQLVALTRYGLSDVKILNKPPRTHAALAGSLRYKVVVLCGR